MLLIIDDEKEKIENKIIKLLKRFHDPNLNLTKNNYKRILMKVKRLKSKLNGETVMQQKIKETIIYKMTLVETGQIYVGRTHNLKQRRYNHNYDAKRCNSRIAKTIKKYGFQAFKFEVIDKVLNPKHAKLVEKTWIDVYKSQGISLNENRGSGGLDRHNAKSILKIKKAQYRCGIKPVLQYDKFGELLREFPSLTDASETTLIPESNISLCCRGRIYSAGGFRWKYKSITENDETKLLHISMNYELKRKVERNNYGNITNIR